MGKTVEEACESDHHRQNHKDINWGREWAWTGCPEAERKGGEGGETLTVKEGMSGSLLHFQSFSYWMKKASAQM